MELPIPTGKEIAFKESTKLIPTRDFFIKYESILNILPIYNAEDGSYSLTDLDVELNINTVEDIKLLKLFLTEIESLEIPAKRYWENFTKELNANLLFDKFRSGHIPSLFVKLKKIVDKHNNYFNTLSSYTLSRVVNNSTMHNTYTVSSDPVNLLEAHVSVDATTGPLKDKAETSAEASEASYRTPGNIINMFEGINENLIGRKGISICATGLKSYFALTLYNNYLLNYGTLEEQERLLLGNDHKGIKIEDKTYNTLANIRALDINTIKNSKVFKALSEVTQDEDIALTLSALLSLATDNAKELALSKLNAGTKMIGMYIYGLSIGMKFDDIANIIMSPVGDVIKNMLDDDKFSDREGFITINKSLFEYFTKGPYRLLKKFDVKYDRKESKFFSKSPMLALHDILVDTYPKDFKEEDSLSDMLINLAKNNVTISNKINFIDKLRGLYNGRFENEASYSKSAVEMYNLLIDFVEDYLQQADVINKNIGTFKDFLKLATGALELKLLGQILGLNLGIKTTTDEFLKQINNFRRAIYDKTEDLEDIIDLAKFALDNSPYVKDKVTYSSYREYVILKYESVKEAFNIFDVVSKVPHFMGYLQTLVTTHVEINNAFTFRSSDNLTLPIKNKLGGYIKEDKLIRGILNFCGDYLIKKWMLDTNKLIIIPRGNSAFDKNGNLYKLKEDTVILLGTDWNNATFRMWMENEVIPNLKLGMILPGKFWGKIANNKFIRDLGNDLLTKTVSRNPTVIYTLPMNMLPNSDLERSMFNLYKSLFNNLLYEYLYELTSYDANEKEVKILSEPMTITDLFIYYAMIANGWKLDLSSLVSITEDFLNKGIIKDLHDYITAMDKSGFTLSLNNIIWEDILPYIAPSDNPYYSSVETIWSRNTITLKRVLMDKINKETANEISEEHDLSGVFGKYQARSVIKNLNYFPTTIIGTNKAKFEGKININNLEADITIEYDLKTRQIISMILNTGNLELLNEYKDKLMKNMETMPLKIVDRVSIPDRTLLEDTIKLIIECY